jgi:transcriptional repressor NrdR
VTRRRRECLACKGRFTTLERAEANTLIIVKKDGRRQEFDRERLRASIQKACAKRPISAETIERAVDQIEAELRSRDGYEVPSRAVGDLVIEKLRGLDKVAYIRFASVYRNFADVSSFEEELRKLLPS